MIISVPTIEVVVPSNPAAVAAARAFLKEWGPKTGLTDNFDWPSGTWAIRIEGDYIAIVNPLPQNPDVPFGSDPHDLKGVKGELYTGQINVDDTQPNPKGETVP